jgi:o-succinylbenzoate synthase
MVYRFEFRPYCRPFRQPIHTHHGLWPVREGIILKLTDNQGKSSFGEVAPLPWFGSETLEQALQFCLQLPPVLSEETLFSILPTLPACQFGFETMFRHRTQPTQAQELPLSRYGALLPSGSAALQAWSEFWHKGHRTFKCKIGLEPLVAELAWLEQLLNQLPFGAKLRLDANGGFDEITARHWLEWCDRNRQRIEYIEQPLPPSEFGSLMRLCDRYQTPIALDESVATLEQLKNYYYQGWYGIFVIKAATIGSPHRLKQFCQNHPIDLVISSVFETSIGRQAVIDLAVELEAILPNAHHRALGLGIQQWLPDDGLQSPDWQYLWSQL